MRSNMAASHAAEGAGIEPERNENPRAEREIGNVEHDSNSGFEHAGDVWRARSAFDCEGAKAA